MDPKHIKICQDSWSKILKHKDDTILIFYLRMFELGGEDVKTLFKTSDMKQQAKRLTAMLSMAVYMLNSPDILISKLEDLGESHMKEHKVKEEHYVYAGQALIYFFEQVLKEEFTEEVKEAWLAVWGVILKCMTKCYHSDEK